MQAAELQTLLARGEDSRHQFKRDFTNADSLAAELAAHILPYRGLGTGIPRALGVWPKIDLLDEREANQFRAVVWRPMIEQASEQVVQKPAAKNELMTEQVTPEVPPEVMKLLKVLNGEMRRGEIMAALGLKDEKHFREHYQQAGMATGLIEMTIPDKPNSSKQRYRLTKLGRAQLDKSINGERQS